ncbi:hypothetical protein SLEP1_g47367 [Rubroshorea leprosula]|uniref:Retrotransposon gag protein n=1 Tax=Rubroshorea leprosula TaxID=152421 RepID=A0AAV5LQ70_9ROSI|nr:hypothetical protein SLEP1_g47367 [Rubroshorea leprosula]
MSTSSSSRTNSNNATGRSKLEALSIASQVRTLAQDMEETRQGLRAIEKAIVSFMNTIEKGRQRQPELMYTTSVEKAFAEEIIKELVPINFKTPQLAEYDGTQDPVEHVQGFRMVMMVHGASDALLCKQFPTTSRKAA